MTRKPPLRATDNQRVLWQGKRHDGFLIISLTSRSHLKGTLYTKDLEFKLDAELAEETAEKVPPNLIVDFFLDRFDAEYLASEVERKNKGVADGSCTLQ